MAEGSKGIAGNTNYRQWDKVTADLVDSHETELQTEEEENRKALGLDGKYASSHAEAEERKKAAGARHAKKTLDKYKKREGQVIQTMSGLFLSLLPSSSPIVRITRDKVDAGKRVLEICDTTGTSMTDCMIVLTQDLNQLETIMPTKDVATPKDYPDNAENNAATTTTRSVYGLIKLFIREAHNCTIVLRCKLISGTVELSHCSNVTLKIEKEATVATLQADLCQHVNVEFHDAPSSKNIPGRYPTIYWGEDENDRIFHAGVSDMKVTTYRDGFVDLCTTVDYIKDGATAIGNATPEEMQFVTSVIDGELQTERVVRHTTGQSNARAMTQRELDAEEERRVKAADLVMEKAIRFEERGEAKRIAPQEKDDSVVGEVCTAEIQMIITDCEANKARGNEAFAAGEYAQALLLYTLALDKAQELPDGSSLFPRHIVLANRSAAFLRLGEHEKALADATLAQAMDPSYVKGIFRRGLALHAMGRYQEAIQVLAEAHKLEPKNKQINQALQFAEVRMTQEMRKRMDS